MNFIDMISTSVNDFELFGNSDVRYKIEGGSQRLIKSIREKISGSIIFNKTLKSVKSNDKEVKVEFADGSSIIADHLILAIPFSTLRRVELAINGMTEQKLYCVENLGYGRNCKIILSTKSRDWRGDGSAGNIINEVLQNGWDSTQCQSNNVGPGSYTIYLGAPIADIFNNSGIRKVTDLKAKFISIINRLFPSTTSIFSGKFRLVTWIDKVEALGSYPCYKIGQWSTLAGHEATQVGRVHFAGDHTSDRFQGYMNGAAESGVRVAFELRQMIRSR